MRAVDVIAAYLANWSIRRGTRGVAATFGRSDSDVWVGYLHLLLGERLQDPVARAVARRDMRVHAVLTEDASPMMVNVAGYLLAAGCSVLADASLERPLAEGGAREATGGAVSLAWRVAFLRALKLHDPAAAHEAGLDDAVGRLERASAAIHGEELEQRLVNLGAVAQAAHALGVAGCDEAAAASRRIVAALGPRLAGDTSAIASSVIGKAGLAGWAAGDTELSHRCAELLVDRVGTRRLAATLPGEDRIETSAWVPAALTVGGADLSELESVLHPPAPPPPAYRIAGVEGDGPQLVVTLDRGPRRVRRSYRTADLDLLLDRVLDQLDADRELSPRLQGHLVIALLELLERTEDAATSARIERIIEASLEEIVARQDDSGGWQYARANVPSMIYASGGVEQTEFPDRQYTIDTAVPGLALLLAHRRRPDPRYVLAARRALDFFEGHVGRLAWDGLTIWHLYPGDDKTRLQGSAVNYELWIGAFMAALLASAPNADVAARVSGYIDDAIAYTATHLLEDGDLRYGDYVRELRTPYASWGGYLLAVIDNLADRPQARAMARRIVGRLAELQLPSGALPNVVDYREEVEGMDRWLVHRHGVGPYPLRAYYQLYFVAATAATGVALEAGARALGFVLVEMLRPTFGDMSTGYLADGRFDVRTDSLARVGRDWLLIALAGLPVVTGLDYRPRLRSARPAPARLRELIDRTGRRAHRLAEANGWPPDAGAEIARARAAVLELAGAEALLERLGRGPVDSAATVPSPPVASPGGELADPDALLKLLERWDAGEHETQMKEAIRRSAGAVWELFSEGGAPRSGHRGTITTATIFRSILGLALSEARGCSSEGVARARAALRHVLMARTSWDGHIVLDVPPADMPLAAAQVFRACAELSVDAPQVVA